MSHYATTDLETNSLTIGSTSVMLLAAGHGSRMRPLTDTTPKPLLKIGEHALIEHHIIKLNLLGFKHLVINTAYLGHQIQQALGNGERYGVEIKYSDESSTGALETAGGIKKSLTLIDSDPFLVINADIYTEFDFSSLLEPPLASAGRLVMVPNPQHNISGDFGIDTDGRFDPESKETMTYSGIALYRKQMFAELPEGKIALGPIIKQRIQQEQLEAWPFHGRWTDVGTPQRLAHLNTIIDC
jgi:MurNAc alpha-1-phosphate uridylyltransferase